MKVYALKLKAQFDFVCLANNSDEFEKKIQQRYWRWCGIQPQGTTVSIDDFLAGYERVCLTIEPYNEKICKRCGGAMKPGKAILETLSGIPDFSGGPVVTVSPGGPEKLIDCLKCEKCGYSVR